MATLNTYLRFNDAKCREAMNFYQQCLGGELSFQTAGESPMASEMPEGSKDLIMHSTLKAPGILIMGSDMMRDKATVGDNFAMSLDCQSEAEIRDLFAKLSAGGDVFMQLEDVPWGAIFGMATDKYGVEWMFNYQKTK